MPFINENTITLTGSYVNADSSYASGSLDFAPASFLVDAAGQQIIAPSVISVSLNNLGHFSVALPATDDPDINPTGWTYTVTERISGAPVRQYSMTLPLASAGSTLDMSAIVPAVPSTGTAAPYLLVPSGTPTIGQVPVVTTVSPLALGWGAGGATLPTQTGNAGKYLTTDGSAPSWGTVSAAAALVPTAVKTANYTAAAGDFVPCDTTSAGFTITLPVAPADKAQVAIKHVIQGSTNAVTIACGGSDVFNKTAGVTSFTLPLLAQGALLQYKASTAIWYVLSDDLALSQLDGRYVLQANAAILDTTAADIEPDVTTGTPVAGATGKASDAGHQHQLVAHDHSTTNKGGTLGLSALSATGTRSSSTFLRGDNTFAVPAGGGGSSYVRGQYTMPTGAVAVTHDKTQVSLGAVSLTSGQTYLVAIELLSGQVVTNLNIRSGSGGLVTVTHSWLTLCDSSRVRLAVAADSVADLAANTNKAFAMGSAYTVPTSGMYYAEIMVAAATVSVLGTTQAIQQHTMPPVTSATGVGSLTTPPSVGSTNAALNPVANPPFIWAS